MIIIAILHLSAGKLAKVKLKQVPSKGDLFHYKGVMYTVDSICYYALHEEDYDVTIVMKTNNIKGE